MNPNKNKKFHDWDIKTGPTILINADFDSMNIPKDDPQRQTMYINKPIGLDYNTVKNPCYEKQKFDKHGSKE